MTADEIRASHAGGLGSLLQLCRDLEALPRASRSLRARLAFVLISKLYRQMYANTGIATDKARAARSVRIARVIAPRCRRFFTAPPMPDLEVPMPHQATVRRLIAWPRSHAQSRTHPYGRARSDRYRRS